MEYILKSCLAYSIFFLAVSGLPLYSPNDRIVLLENDTITETIYNSPVAWFVEFYSSWCGHCQSFAPSWKRLARQVEGWTNVIRVAAIDCSEERNFITCENFSIQGYPSLKFFKAFTVDTKDIGSLYQGKKSPKKMLHAMIDFIETEGHPKVQPDFTPLDTKLSDEFYKENYSPKQLAVVFENDISYLGKELILDLMNNPKISVKRVVNDVDRAVKYNVTKLPQVVLLMNNKNVYLVNHTRQGILAELQTFHVVLKNPPTPKVIQATNLHFEEVHKNDAFNFQLANVSVVYMQDLEGALTFMFKREIVIKKIIKGERLKAFEEFLDLLVKCFPGRPPVNNFLRLFQGWLKGRAKRSVTPASLRMFYAMHQADANSQLPDDINWQTCQGSMPQYRGYPCSLWLLFHTLTVTCANRNVSQLSGADVLVRIRGYVTNFFGCLECGKHFAAMSKTVETEVNSLDEAVLWLWKSHNKVNKRLSKEPSTDPKFPKIQYPPRDMCGECIIDDKNLNSHPKWRTDVILQFLKVHYGMNNIRLIKEENEKETDEKEASESVSFMNGRQIVQAVGLGLNNLDASLCLVVYATGVVVLVSLYVYILRRRRRNIRHQSHLGLTN